MSKKKPIELTPTEKQMAIVMWRSGNFYAKEICDKLGIYNEDLKRIVEEAGYGY